MVVHLKDKEIIAQFNIWLRVRKWSIRKAAAKLDINHSYLAKMLKHKANPTPNYLSKMCFLLHKYPIDFATLTKK